VNLKTGIAGLVAVFVIFFIMTSPDNAATIARGSWAFVVHLAHGLGTFVDKLSS
jgi:hypothetical protein